MYSVLLVIHTILVLFLIGIILVQRSDSDGFGAGGGSNQFMTGRGTANLITRTTAILATLFIINSLVLAYLSANKNKTSIVEKIEQVDVATPDKTSDPTKTSSPKETPPSAPAVPKPE